MRNLFAGVQPLHLKGNAIEMGWPSWPWNQKGALWGVPAGRDSPVGSILVVHFSGCVLTVSLYSLLVTGKVSGFFFFFFAPASEALSHSPWLLLESKTRKGREKGMLKDVTKDTDALTTWVINYCAHKHRVWVGCKLVTQDFCLDGLCSLFYIEGLLSWSTFLVFKVPNLCHKMLF